MSPEELPARRQVQGWEERAWATIPRRPTLQEGRGHLWLHNRRRVQLHEHEHGGLQVPGGDHGWGATESTPMQGGS